VICESSEKFMFPRNWQEFYLCVWH